MNRRRLLALAGAFTALAATPSAAANIASLVEPPGGLEHCIRIVVQVDERLPAAIRELAGLLPLAADCDIGTRRHLVELLEHGNRFVEALDLDQHAAAGAMERSIVLQPSNLLLLCVAALARYRQGGLVHQGHVNCFRRLSRNATVAGRRALVEYVTMGSAVDNPDRAP